MLTINRFMKASKLNKPFLNAEKHSVPYAKPNSVFSMVVSCQNHLSLTRAQSISMGLVMPHIYSIL